MKIFLLLILTLIINNCSQAQTIFDRYTLITNQTPGSITLILLNDGIKSESKLDSVISTSYFNQQLIDKKIIYYTGIGFYNTVFYDTITIPLLNTPPYLLKLFVNNRYSFPGPSPFLNDSLLLNINTSGYEIINPQYSKFSIYPNPASEFLTLDLENISDVKSIKLYNLLNQEVKDFSLNFNKLDIQDIKNGIYIIRIYTKNDVLDKKIQIIR